MLNRLSASALLKAVIGVMAACVVAVLAVSGWTSWQRLQTAGRITVIAEASASAFKAMHNLRNDRPSTSRLLSSDQVIQPDMTSYLRTIRGDEMPAMRATVELLPAVDFADKETLIPALSRLAGEKAEINASQWSPITVGRMATAVTVAESALEQAKIRASAQWSAAREQLILQLSLLAGALALALGSMMTVSHRVINPLHAIRDAMLKVAAGDLSIDAGYAERRDEIGALAGALGVFKQQAIEKARIEQQERDRHLGAAARQRDIEDHIADFEAQIRQTLNALDSASDQMWPTSDDMSQVLSQINTQVLQSARALGEGSNN